MTVALYKPGTMLELNDLPPVDYVIVEEGADEVTARADGWQSLQEMIDGTLPKAKKAKAGQSDPQ